LIPKPGIDRELPGGLRAECLNREHLWTLAEARVVGEDFRGDNQQHILRPGLRLSVRCAFVNSEVAGGAWDFRFREESRGIFEVTPIR